MKVIKIHLPEAGALVSKSTVGLIWAKYELTAMKHSFDSIVLKNIERSDMFFSLVATFIKFCSM